MEPTRTAQSVDRSHARLLVGMIHTGVWVTYAVAFAMALWVALTWDQPNRSLIVALDAAAVAGAFVVSRLPAERVVRSRYREPFLLGWTALDVAIVAASVALDGGGRSPVALVLFLTMVFAALSYTRALVVVVTGLSVVAFLAVELLAGPADAAYLVLFSVSLAAAGAMCTLHAHIHARQRDELEEMSRTDPLTGCLNRRGFEERLAAELDSAGRGVRELAIVLLDLDGFKQVNDTGGHAAGDELLCFTAGTVRQTVRPMDSVARLGGDEFAILVPRAGRANALQTASRVRAALGERVSVSIGLACYPEDGGQQDELYRHADVELYAHKTAGALYAPSRVELSFAAAVAGAVDARMSPGREHSLVVAELGSAVADRLGWSGDELELLRIAAMLHDVGKISTPDWILTKPGPLTPEEYEEIKRHPVEGARIVGRVEGLAEAAPWIRHSHENFDGSGYPDGLSGEAIPLASRILLVADAYDAMTGRRPYRPPLSCSEALAELARCAGWQFDPRCVGALRAALRDGELAMTRA